MSKAEQLRAQRIKNLARGGKKGLKRKSTKIREALTKMGEKLLDGSAVTPLEAMLVLLNESYKTYQKLAAAAVPQDEEKAEKLATEFRRAKASVLEIAVAAAPYTSPKLQSIDKSVKRNLTVEIISFRDALPLRKREEIECERIE